ncbi:MAG TPA: DUF541 domain-containing protein [bacterium (Candidatus Stahlbacteria)]|nr:DUF541 domain-containing protein [Candidatus Stahlbacteria bacterium]
MKPIMNIFLLAFICSAFAGGEGEPRLVTVTGDAEVRVVPDEVIITLGVETFDQNLTVAKKKNDRSVKRIIGLADKYEIKKKYLQTSHISVVPDYDHYQGEAKLVGYFVRKTIVITLKDLSRFEGLLTDALKSGANYVHGIQFRTTKLRKHRDQARALAINAAREKAAALASELNQKIGKPYTINEEPTWWWSYYNSWWGRGWGSRMSQNVVPNVGGSYQGESGTIALGQITVNARVRVSFELK